MSTAELDALVAEAIVDCHDEDEQASGLYTMIADNLSLPFTTTVLGVEATVADVDLTGRGEILAICRRGRFEQAVGILDLPLPEPPPRGHGVDRSVSALGRLRRPEHPRWRPGNERCRRSGRRTPMPDGATACRRLRPPEAGERYVR